MPEEKELHDIISTTGSPAPSSHELFYKRPRLWLSIVGVFGLVALLTYSFLSSREWVETAALENAESYSDALAESRSIYPSEGVKMARARKNAVTHDYHPQDHPIPQPATLSILLGAFGLSGLVSASLRRRRVEPGECSRAASHDLHEPS